MTASKAIEKSRKKNEIVRMEPSIQDRAEILAKCEGRAYHGNWDEFWGADWRVTMTIAAK